MINTISVYVTDFGNIELDSKLTASLEYETKPAISFDGDKYMDTQPKPLPINPTFWAYIENQIELIKADLSDTEYTERRRAQQ